MTAPAEFPTHKPAWSAHVKGSRTSLALRGLIALVVAVALYAFTFAWGGNAFADNPEVTVDLPASAGALDVDSGVQYRGVNIGKVADVVPGEKSSQVTLALQPDYLDSVPADAQVRVVPRTVFGDYYVQLDRPAGAPPQSEPLQAGAAMVADQSRPTVQLYQAIARVHDLFVRLDPSQLNVALTTVATALHTASPDLGPAIDSLDRSLGVTAPALDHLGTDLEQIASISDGADAVAPDALATLQNLVVPSQTIVAKQQNLGALLSAGTTVAGQVNSMLYDDKDRIITLVGDIDPVLQTVNSTPGQLTNVYNGISTLASRLPVILQQGPYLSVDAGLSLKDLQTYQAAQCAQYGTLPAANCPTPAPTPPPATQGSSTSTPAPTVAPASAPLLSGSSGPVGSPTEQAQLATMFGSTNTSLDAVLAGPIVRGATVVA